MQFFSLFFFSYIFSILNFFKSFFEFYIFFFFFFHTKETVIRTLDNTQDKSQISRGLSFVQKASPTVKFTFYIEFPVIGILLPVAIYVTMLIKLTFVDEFLSNLHFFLSK